MRMVLAVVCLSAFHCVLFGQEERTSFREIDGLWEKANRPAWDTQAADSDATTEWKNFPSAPELQRSQEAQKETTVSAEELRHPLSRKGRKLLDKAERYSQAGDSS